MHANSSVIAEVRNIGEDIDSVAGRVRDASDRSRDEARALSKLVKDSTKHTQEEIADLSHQVQDKLVAVADTMDITAERIRQLVLASENFPTSYTVDFVSSKQKKIRLRILSDISGECFHKPIDIKVPSAFLAKYGHAIKGVLSLFVTVTVAAQSLVQVGATAVTATIAGITATERAVSLASTSATNAVDRATQFHRATRSTGLERGEPIDTTADDEDKLNPAEALRLVKDLLKLHDPDFSPGDVSRVSGLVCGIMSTGRKVWATKTELEQYPEITLKGSRDPLDILNLTNRHQVNLIVGEISGVPPGWCCKRIEWYLMEAASFVGSDSSNNNVVTTAVPEATNGVALWSKPAMQQLCRCTMDDLRAKKLKAVLTYKRMGPGHIHNKTTEQSLQLRSILPQSTSLNLPRVENIEITFPERLIIKGALEIQ